jgi:glycosyltransferase involved in cell wall biosynthesis
VIYVCIPTHNEESTIGLLLWKIRRVLVEFGRDFEVLVLDDASTDRTAETLSRYAQALPLHVIRAERRLGYGSALERLLKEAVERSPYPKRDVAVTLQGDFTEDPADMVTMVKRIEGGADVVAGSPEPPEGEPPAYFALSRRLARHLLGKAYRGAPVSYPLSGFRAYRVVVLKKALRDLEKGGRLVDTSGWGANVELLSTVASHARRIEESPFRPSYSRRTRPSRFRPLPNLRGLIGLRRRTAWPAAQTSGRSGPSS